MTSANVFNLNSVNQSQILNANAATGKQKAENPEAASVFASLMNGNYSTNQTLTSAQNNLSSVYAGGTEKASLDNSYERYQYRNNEIDQAQSNDIADKISDSSDKLESFEEVVVQTVADELGVDENSVKEALENLGMTVFDLLDPQNLAQLATQLVGGESPAELLTNPQFLDLMQDMGQLGVQLLDDLGLAQGQMGELVSQMDILNEPQTIEQTEFVDLLSGTGVDESVNTDPNEGTVISDEMTTAVVEEGASSERDRISEPDQQPAEVEDESSTSEMSDETVQPEEENDAKNREMTEDQSQNEDSSQNLSRNSVGSNREGSAAGGQDGIVFAANEVASQEAAETTTVDTSYLSIDTLDLIEQIAENVRIGISEGTTSMEMQLNPENLGKVYLQISSKEGIVNAHIAASNEAVKAALELQIADLRQNLNQAGVKVDAIEVTVASHEFEKNLDQNQNNEQQQGERQQEKLSHRRNINLSSLEELSGVMTEEEALAAQIMRDNGNSVDLTA